jgi:hypothetical protein
MMRDRLGAKHLWLIYVRQLTRWISCNLRDVDVSIAPFVIALKSSVANRMLKIISICKKNNQIISSVTYLPQSLDEFLFLSLYPFIFWWAVGYCSRRFLYL